MTNKNRYVLNQIRQVAKKTAPEGSMVLLFGSRARGQARKGSDWDILIVLPKSQLQQADYDQVSYPLVELGWTLGEQINPIVSPHSTTMCSAMPSAYCNCLWIQICSKSYRRRRRSGSCRKLTTWFFRGDGVWQPIGSTMPVII